MLRIRRVRAGRVRCALGAVLGSTLVATLALGGCGSDSPTATPDGTTPDGTTPPGSTPGPGGKTDSQDAAAPKASEPGPDASAGNPSGGCVVPNEAKAEDVTHPTTVVGTGTPASCTSEAFVAAVAKGGVITFDCGPSPATIIVKETAKVYNDAAPKVVIDGGNKVTLSGGGKVRILYQNSCSSELHGGANCNDKQEPALTVQNLTFIDGNASGLEKDDNEGGGGAIWVRGGRFKVVHSRFFGNTCDALGSDVGGGAIRVLDFPSNSTSQTRPVFITDSTFGGDKLGNHCANGGALSSIGTSYTIINSEFSNNTATGHGANDGQGGNGGAIYNDGNTYTLDICGTHIEGNHANEGGSAVFYVSNDKSGELVIKDSIFRKNPKGTFETDGYPGMFIIAKEGYPIVTNSTIE